MAVVPGVSGFGAKVEVNDGGNGGAIGGASTVFDGVVEVNFPSAECNTFDASELGQADAYEKMLPTGTLKQTSVKCMAKWSKANFTRINTLLNKRGYTFKVTSSDDQTTPGTPVTQICTFVGFISKLDEVKFTKTDGVMIPFELTPQQAPVYS